MNLDLNGPSTLTYKTFQVASNFLTKLLFQVVRSPCLTRPTLVTGSRWCLMATRPCQAPDPTRGQMRPRHTCPPPARWSGRSLYSRDTGHVAHVSSSPETHCPTLNFEKKIASFKNIEIESIAHGGCPICSHTCRTCLWKCDIGCDNFLKLQ